jgi:DNA-binding response OmpR family regulator
VTSKVLLVDASPSTRKAVELALPASAFDLRVAPDGLAAIRLLPDFSPEAVLLALFLPGMDGVEVAAFLRSQPEYRTTALFLLRGPFETLDSSKLSSFDHDGLVQKPFDGDSLHRLVRTAIDRKRERPRAWRLFLNGPTTSSARSARSSARRSSAIKPRWRTGPGTSSRPSSRKSWSKNSRPSTPSAEQYPPCEFPGNRV